MKVVLIDPLELRVLLRDVVEQSVRKVLSETGIMGAIGAKEDLLTVEEAAKLLRLAKSTLYSMASKEQIPSFKRSRRLYFRRSELLQWIAEGRTSKLGIRQVVPLNPELV